MDMDVDELSYKSLSNRLQVVDVGDPFNWIAIFLFVRCFQVIIEGIGAVSSKSKESRYFDASRENKYLYKK